MPLERGGSMPHGMQGMSSDVPEARSALGMLLYCWAGL
jgi:hypothetical protein